MYIVSTYYIYYYKNDLDKNAIYNFQIPVKIPTHIL